MRILYRKKFTPTVSFFAEIFSLVMIFSDKKGESSLCMYFAMFIYENQSVLQSSLRCASHVSLLIISALETSTLMVIFNGVAEIGSKNSYTCSMFMTTLSVIEKSFMRVFSRIASLKDACNFHLGLLHLLLVERRVVMLNTLFSVIFVLSYIIMKYS